MMNVVFSSKGHIGRLSCISKYCEYHLVSRCKCLNTSFSSNEFIGLCIYIYIYIFKTLYIFVCVWVCIGVCVYVCVYLYSYSNLSIFPDTSSVHICCHLVSTPMKNLILGRFFCHVKSCAKMSKMSVSRN